MNRMPPFKFSQKKATQAVGLLLKQSELKRDNYMRIIKLLYIADRESLRETGRPITGDRFVAMERGPVLSTLLNLINDVDTGSSEWRKFITKRGYDICLENDPGNGELCRYEIKKLKEVWDRYRDNDEWDMVNETHKLPEWAKNNPRKSSKPIPLADVLDAVGIADLQAEIEQAAREANAFTHFFRG